MTLYAYAILTSACLAITVFSCLLTNAISKSRYYATSNGILLLLCAVCTIPVLNIFVALITLCLLFSCVFQQLDLTNNSFFSKYTFYKD